MISIAASLCGLHASETGHLVQLKPVRCPRSFQWETMVGLVDCVANGSARKHRRIQHTSLGRMAAVDSGVDIQRLSFCSLYRKHGRRP